MQQQHYVPQFYLRNFASDSERKKINTVAKNGSHAIWTERSIKALGFENDLYVHFNSGIPVSVENMINRQIETPISKSDTWAKIVSGRTDTLDRSDKPILYALIRHLEARNPHYRSISLELSKLALEYNNNIPFIQEELEHYVFMHTYPNITKNLFNLMASSLDWTEERFIGAGLSILRSPVPLRSSTTPVMVLPAPPDPALYLPLPGMTPYQLILPLNRTTIASLVLGNFNDGFRNIEISADEARAFNRRFVCHFAHFENVRHLITDRHDLVADMTWAPYDLVEDVGRKITFRRRG